MCGYTCQNHNVTIRHAVVRNVCNNFDHVGFYNVHLNLGIQGHLCVRMVPPLKCSHRGWKPQPNIMCYSANFCVIWGRL